MVKHPLKDTLIAVQKALAGIPELKYIAEDWGQLDYYSQRPPVQFPCALIDTEEIDFKDASGRIQTAGGRLTVRLADNKILNGSFKAPDPDEAFDFFDLHQSVFKALQGLDGSTFTPLTRRNTRKAHRDDSIREVRVYFQFGYTDQDAAPKRQSVRPNIEVRMEG